MKFHDVFAELCKINFVETYLQFAVEYHAKTRAVVNHLNKILYHWQRKFSNAAWNYPCLRIFRCFLGPTSVLLLQKQFLWSKQGPKYKHSTIENLLELQVPKREEVAVLIENYSQKPVQFCIKVRILLSNIIPELRKQSQPMMSSGLSINACLENA